MLKTMRARWASSSRLGQAFALALVCALGLSCKTTTTKNPSDSVWGQKKGGADKGRSIVLERVKSQAGTPSPVFELLEAELDRNLSRLSSDEQEIPAYFLAYDLVSRQQLWLEAHEGVIVRDSADRDRTVDIDVRVGSRQLDNGHTQGGYYGPGNGLGVGLPISVEDNPLSLSQALWMLTETQYRDALDSLSRAESEEQLRIQDEEKPESPDFSKEQPNIHIEPPVTLDLEAVSEEWAPRIEQISAILGGDPRVLESSVVLLVVGDNRVFVNSEKTRIQGSHVRFRVMLNALAQAEDGMQLTRFETFEVHTAEQLPAQSLLLETAARLRSELLALREAALAEPYAGPAVLEGRAAGVFFHEIFGHRLEGHRQKDDLEGQTFADMLGKRVLPTFLDMVDDPTVSSLDGVPLSGHYHVDDEGVQARRVALVERGKLKAFLLGRSPVLPFKRSNGHGRRERGAQVVARQGNLIVTSRKTIPDDELRAALISEVKRQGKPYGLWFSDIQGGYTITDRSGPQAFKVMPLMVYRVWPDGRPDELVRGADIVGTPIAAFETILATGDSPGIFNGMCGAESGDVPVAAVSPALLLRNIEIERASHNRDRPPLLEPPGRGECPPGSGSTSTQTTSSSGAAAAGGRP